MFEAMKVWFYSICKRKTVFKMLKFDSVEGMPEILFYFGIEGLGDFLWSMKRAVSHGGADPASVAKDVADARADQQTLLGILKTREGFAFADHDEYMRWYRWWNVWHKQTLSNDQFNELNRLLSWDGTQTEETFAKWRPSGTWKIEVPTGDRCDWI